MEPFYWVGLFALRLSADFALVFCFFFSFPRRTAPRALSSLMRWLSKGEEATVSQPPFFAPPSLSLFFVAGWEDMRV
jgi:hypothetical protein